MVACLPQDARTKWFDAAVEDAVAGGRITQVVVVAAGFDTRAQRYARPGVSFYEVDLPHASTKKQRLLEKLEARSGDGTRRLPRATHIAADLAITPLDEALRGTGFDASKPALFTLEGAARVCMMMLACICLPAA